MDYIQVENGEVKGYPQPLPRNWADVSNFYLLDDVQVLSYGWYPVRFVPAEKTDNDVVTGQSFVIEGNEVVQYEQIRPKTESEIQEELNSKWENIRNQRNLLLLESDWTQLADVSLSDEKKEEWKLYRQSLRDITNFDSPDHVIWPNKPE